VPCLTNYGNIWKSIKRRNGSLISINCDCAIRVYRFLGHGIRIA